MTTRQARPRPESPRRRPSRRHAQVGATKKRQALERPGRNEHEHPGARNARCRPKGDPNREPVLQTIAQVERPMTRSPARIATVGESACGSQKGRRRGIPHSSPWRATALGDGQAEVLLHHRQNRREGERPSPWRRRARPSQRVRWPSRAGSGLGSISDVVCCTEQCKLIASRIKVIIMNTMFSY